MEGDMEKIRARINHILGVRNLKGITKWLNPLLSAALPGAKSYLAFLVFITFLAVITSIFLQNQPLISEAPFFEADSISQTKIGRFFLLPWYRWDTVHYIAIARLGYGEYPYSSAWPPLYPFVIKVFSVFIKPTLLAALAGTGIATLLFFVLFYIYVRKTRDEDTAKRTLLWVIAFPTSFFLFAGYTESLFLVFAVAVLFAARSGRYLLAGLFAAFATLTRHPGVLLAIPIAIYAFQDYAHNPEKKISGLIMHLLPAAYPFVVFSLFAIYVKFGLRSYWPWETLEMFWGYRNAWPWVDIWNDLAGAIHFFQSAEGFFHFNWIFNPLICFIIMAVLVAGRRQLDLAENAYSWAMYLLFLSGINNIGHTVSFTRYMLSVFPVFIVMAMRVKSPLARSIFLIIFLASAIFYIVIFRMGFFIA